MSSKSNFASFGGQSEQERKAMAPALTIVLAVNATQNAVPVVNTAATLTGPNQAIVIPPPLSTVTKYPYGKTCG